MKNVYYININNFKVNQVDYVHLLPIERRIRIESAVSGKKAKQICMAGLLVRYSLEKFGLDPDLIMNVKTSSAGKPYLKDIKFNFNLSHSGTIVCIVASDKTDVGIDVQTIKRNIAYAMKGFFSAEDLLADEMPDDMQGTILWSKKEAFLKCIGTGWNLKAAKVLSVKNECVACNNSIYHFKTKEMDQAIMTVCGIENLDDLSFTELEVCEFEKLYR